MALLTVHARNEDIAFQPASAGGDEFPNDGDTEVIVFNRGLADVDVTFATQRPCNHGFVDDKVETAGSAEYTPMGPFEASRFNTSTGRVQFTYADATNLLVGVRKLR